MNLKHLVQCLVYSKCSINIGYYFESEPFKELTPIDWLSLAFGDSNPLHSGETVRCWKDDFFPLCVGVEEDIFQSQSFQTHTFWGPEKMPLDGTMLMGQAGKTMLYLRLICLSDLADPLVPLLSFSKHCLFLMSLWERKLCARLNWDWCSSLR